MNFFSKYLKLILWLAVVYAASLILTFLGILLIFKLGKEYNYWDDAASHAMTTAAQMIFSWIWWLVVLIIYAIIFIIIKSQRRILTASIFLVIVLIGGGVVYFLKNNYEKAHPSLQSLTEQAIENKDPEICRKAGYDVNKCLYNAAVLSGNAAFCEIARYPDDCTDVLILSNNYVKLECGGENHKQCIEQTCDSAECMTSVAILAEKDRKWCLDLLVGLKNPFPFQSTCDEYFSE